MSTPGKYKIRRSMSSTTSSILSFPLLLPPPTSTCNPRTIPTTISVFLLSRLTTTLSSRLRLPTILILDDLKFNDDASDPRRGATTTTTSGNELWLSHLSIVLYFSIMRHKHNTLTTHKQYKDCFERFIRKKSKIV